MQISDITKHSSNVDRKRVGRGGKRGKTAGRGHKGQNARAGNSKRPEFRDKIKKFPKLRGQGLHGNKNKDIVSYYAPVNVSALEANFEAKAEVNPTTLVAAGLVKKTNGRIPRVKILGNGDISKDLTVADCKVSKAAEEKITAAGGSIA